MDNACDALEREFKRINNDLEFVGHRFEAEFRSSPNAPDVMGIYRRLQQAEAKMAKLRQKSALLAETKAAFMKESVLSSLSQNEETLGRALFQCGCAPTIPAEVAARLELNKENATATATAAAVPAPAPSATATASTATVTAAKGKPVAAASAVKAKKQSTALPPAPPSAAKKPKAAPSAPAPASTAPSTAAKAPSQATSRTATKARRSIAPGAKSSAPTASSALSSTTSSEDSADTACTGPTFAAPQLTEARFLALPETIRGRSKFGDVSAIYGRMVQYAKRYSVGPAVADALGGASGGSRRSSVGGGRRSSVGGSGSVKIGTFPPLVYSIKELTAGAPPAYVPFGSAVDIAAASAANAANAKNAMKLSGKSGLNVLMSLKALGLIALEASAESAHAHSTGGSGGTGLVKDTVRLVLTSELEDDLIEMQEQLVAAHNSSNSISSNTVNSTPFAAATATAAAASASATAVAV